MIPSTSNAGGCASPSKSRYDSNEPSNKELAPDNKDGNGDKNEGVINKAVQSTLEDCYMSNILTISEIGVVGGHIGVVIGHPLKHLKALGTVLDND